MAAACEGLIQEMLGTLLLFYDITWQVVFYFSSHTELRSGFDDLIYDVVRAERSSPSLNHDPRQWSTKGQTSLKLNSQMQRGDRRGVSQMVLNYLFTQVLRVVIHSSLRKRSGSAMSSKCVNVNIGCSYRLIISTEQVQGKQV